MIQPNHRMPALPYVLVILAAIAAGVGVAGSSERPAESAMPARPALDAPAECPAMTGECPARTLECPGMNAVEKTRLARLTA